MDSKEEGNKGRDQDDKKNFKITRFRCMVKADQYAPNCPVSEKDLTQVRDVTLSQNEERAGESTDNPI